MQITRIDDTISISGQITVADVQRLADLGFKGIICNRPDNEDHVQPPFAEIEKAALGAGIEARHVPISHSGMSMTDVEDFARAREDMPGPHIGYCHAGPRASTIWALHEASTGEDVGTILQKAGAAGFRLDHMAGVLGQLAANAA